MGSEGGNDVGKGLIWATGKASTGFAPDAKLAATYSRGFPTSPNRARPRYRARPRLLLILLAPSLSPHLLFLRREFLTLGLGKILELFFGHRLGHLFRRAFEARFAGFAALGCQCCASGHLLFFRFCRHNP